MNSISKKFFSLGGAGGKGTWGRICEDYGNEGGLIDPKDPNYDSDNMVFIENFII